MIDVIEQVRTGICPSCGYHLCMADGRGNLWCPACGDAYTNHLSGELMESLTPDQEVDMTFGGLLRQLRTHKPNDRSDRDRYWAIVITEVEKAKAVWQTYAQA